MKNFRTIAIVCLLSLNVHAANQAQPTAADLKQQVINTERAFAKTMADRDFEAFKSFLSPEAVFFSGTKATRGKEDVASSWKSLYEKPDPEFSWEPATVEVLDSGKLALSSGPVHDVKGKLIATYLSIWRQEAPNTWRIVFDKGTEACECQKQP